MHESQWQRDRRHRQTVKTLIHCLHQFSGAVFIALPRPDWTCKCCAVDPVRLPVEVDVVGHPVRVLWWVDPVAFVVSGERRVQPETSCIQTGYTSARNSGVALALESAFASCESHCGVTLRHHAPSSGAQDHEQLVRLQHCTDNCTQQDAH